MTKITFRRMRSKIKLNSKWYENFFQGIALEMWRKATSPEQTRLEVDFLHRALKLQEGSRVLDVPCGFGRHSLELASRGCRMTGVDQSPQMIEECRAATSRAGLSIEWRIAEMQHLAWENEFDAGFCFGNSFGYLDAEGTHEFLKAAAQALRPGARFALDYSMVAESILHDFASGNGPRSTIFCSSKRTNTMLPRVVLKQRTRL